MATPTTRRTCYVHDCESTAIKKGLCNKHNHRLRRTGDPEKLLGYRSHATPVSQRFANHVNPGDPDDCWEWTGTLDSHGYGVISEVIDGRYRQYKAHRISYEIDRGTIDPDLYVCHTCDNPRCVNPAHLYLGTHDDNMADRWSDLPTPRPNPEMTPPHSPTR